MDLVNALALIAGASSLSGVAVVMLPRRLALVAVSIFLAISAVIFYVSMPPERAGGVAILMAICFVLGVVISYPFGKKQGGKPPRQR